MPTPDDRAGEKASVYARIVLCLAVWAVALLVILATTSRATTGESGPLYSERDKPLIITEYGVLMPSEYLGSGDTLEERKEDGDRVVVAFMEGTFDFLLTARDPLHGYPADEDRLVQRWLWFSLNCPLYEEIPEGGFNGPLYDWHNPDQLTVFGEFYKDYVRRHTEGARLFLPLALRRLSPTQ